MARQLYQKALHITEMYDVLGKKFPSVPDERLAAFLAGDTEAGPKLVNTTFHWRGLTKEQMRSSKWNRELIHKLATEANKIFSEHQDGRFGKSPIDFEQLFYDRFGKFFRMIDNFRPKSFETQDQRATQLESSHRRQKASTKTSGTLKTVSDDRSCTSVLV
jgi:hypothetical protein